MVNLEKELIEDKIFIIKNWDSDLESRSKKNVKYVQIKRTTYILDTNVNSKSELFKNELIKTIL